MAKKKAPAPQPQRGHGLEAGTNPLANVDDGLVHHHRPSEDLIYESVMRGGGEPFGPPYSIGLQSLTDKVVKFFKQRSFFGFEIFEKSRAKRRRNRFTRYGASRYFGSYDQAAAGRARRELGRKPGGSKKK